MRLASHIIDISQYIVENNYQIARVSVGVDINLLLIFRTILAIT